MNKTIEEITKDIESTFSIYGQVSIILGSIKSNYNLEELQKKLFAIDKLIDSVKVGYYHAYGIDRLINVHKVDLNDNLIAMIIRIRQLSKYIYDLRFNLRYESIEKLKEFNTDDYPESNYYESLRKEIAQAIFKI